MKRILVAFFIIAFVSGCVGQNNESIATDDINELYSISADVEDLSNIELGISETNAATNGMVLDTKVNPTFTEIK